MSSENQQQVPIPAAELSSIVLLRGIASLMVCCYHLTCGNKIFLSDCNWMKQMCSGGWAGVELFFVISGFVIPFSMWKHGYQSVYLGRFLKKRIIRIEPPYLVSIVLVVLLNFISVMVPGYRGADYHPDWVYVFGHAIYLNVFTGEKWLADVYWTLAVELQFYLLVALGYRLIVRPKSFANLFLIALLVLFFMTGWAGEAFILNWSVYFILGILLFQYHAQLVNKKEWLFLSAILMILISIQQSIALAVALTIALALIQWVKKIPRVWQQLGAISYSLYLIHIPIGGRIINFVEARTESVVQREWAVIGALMVCIGFSFLFYQLIERPFKKWAASIPYQPIPLNS